MAKKTKSKPKQPKGLGATKEVMRGVLTKSVKGDDVLKQLYVEPFREGIQSLSCELKHDNYSKWKKAKAK
jgi:hypothetical protein